MPPNDEAVSWRSGSLSDQLNDEGDKDANQHQVSEGPKHAPLDAACHIIPKVLPLKTDWFTTSPEIELPPRCGSRLSCHVRPLFVALLLGRRWGRGWWGWSRA